MVVSSTHARVAPGSSFAHTYEQHLPHGEQLEEEGEGEGKGGPNSGPAEEEGEGKGIKTNGKGRCLEILSAELMGEESVYIGSILQAGATIGRINAHLHATHSSSNISLSSVTLAHTDQSLDLHSSIVHLAGKRYFIYIYIFFFLVFLVFYIVYIFIFIGVYIYRVLGSFSLYWCSVSCFTWSGALDRQPWCSSVISFNATSILHNRYTDIYQYSYKHINI